LIDALSFIGKYPFRKVSASILDIVRVHEVLGFTDVFIGSFSSLFYRDFNEGNGELLEELARFPREQSSIKIHIVAGVNPTYLSGVRDVCKLREHYSAILMSPLLHGFDLAARRVLRVVETASKCDLPVLILGYLEDPREMHRAYRFRYRLNVERVKRFLDLLKKSQITPKLALISFPSKLLLEVASELNKLSIYVDVSSDDVYGPIYDYVKLLVDSVGEDLVVFASKAPLTYLKAVLFKVIYADIEERVKEKILVHNAKRLLNLG
jgi:predicted TIM-barrel fold metal-dependent hydrolase